MECLSGKTKEVALSRWSGFIREQGCAVCLSVCLVLG